MAAIFSLTPLISMLLDAFASLLSCTSSAQMEAPAVSPTNRMPSCPKANEPADFSSALPGCRLEVEAQSARIAVHRMPGR